jgi:hypothetical protein
MKRREKRELARRITKDELAIRKAKTPEEKSKAEHNMAMTIMTAIENEDENSFMDIMQFVDDYVIKILGERSQD